MVATVYCGNLAWPQPGDQILGVNMFKIGEFSKLMQVSIRMLRYYDETGLLKPARIDAFTNYRLYTTAQITALNKIIFLRDLGFNVSEIARAMNDWDDDRLTGTLDNKRVEIENAIKEQQAKLKKIELAQKDIKNAQMAIHYNVAIKKIPGYQVLSLRRIVPDYYAEGQLWAEMSAYADKNQIPISSKTFTIYHDPDYKEADVDIEICAPVDKVAENTDGFTYRPTEPVAFMACLLVYGPFSNIAGAYLSFAGWLEEHNQYQMNGQTRQMVHRGPWNEKNQDKYITEIQIPLDNLRGE